MSFLASRKTWVDSLANGGGHHDHIYKRYKAAAKRIICPSEEALGLTVKPLIKGAVSMGCFKIPENRLLSCAMDTNFCVDLMEIQSFCDHIGYPVLVKGVQMGSALCRQWSQVINSISSQASKSKRSQEQFVQKFIPGMYM